MITPRWYQQEAIAAIYHYFMSKDGNPLIGLPTGTGKSLIPALFIYNVMRQWPNQRFLLLTHVKELIQQNADVIREVWDNVPLGIYSAGLKEKNPVMPIVYAGVQSAKNHPYLFGHRDIIFIDEAHLVNQDEASMYIGFLQVMKALNPKVKVIGLSATLYRMGQGMLHDGSLIFTDVIYDKTNFEGFNQLLNDKVMKPLIPLRTKIELDVSNVGMAKGEFIQSQLQHAVDVAQVTWESLRELVEAGHNRRSWLIFASGIEHAEHIAAMLGQFGIDCAAVHSKQAPEYNDRAIRAFKDFSLRAIVNYGKLTTGFNHPAIDLIGMLRPTMSVPLWVQMLGRGTRPIGENCLVLDYARNAPRLGPINDPVIPRKKGEGAGDVPIKLCDHCGAFNHIKVKTCVNCGREFTFEIKITKRSGDAELIKSDLPIIEEFKVDNVIYAKNVKAGKSPNIKVTYQCGLRSFNEWLLPEYPGGLPRHKFHEWWRQRHLLPPPSTVDDALKYTHECKVPKKIKVWLNKRYPEITGVEF